MLYESCADTAKRVRKILKARFPGVTFSVRSKTYSGGASINVSWTAGPTEEQVSKYTHEFEGATFDGMIDLKSVRVSQVADRDGTITDISHGADYIFCNRHIPEQVWVDEANVMLIRFGRDVRVQTMEDVCKCRERIGNDWLQQAVGRELRKKELAIA